jgi:hypothetical protein
MQLVFYHGVFGGWGWEALDDRESVVCESSRVFDTREECEEDARARGFACGEAVELALDTRSAD